MKNVQFLGDILNGCSLSSLPQSTIRGVNTGGRDPQILGRWGRGVTGGRDILLYLREHPLRTSPREGDRGVKVNKDVPFKY